MKKLILLISLIISYAGSAQVVFKTEYIGTSSYRMMEGDRSKKVGDSKGSAMVYQGVVNFPLSVDLNEDDRPTLWAINAGGAYADLNNKNFTEPLVIDDILNLSLGVMHMRPLNKKWSLLATIGAGLYMPSTNLSQAQFKNVLGNIGAVFIRHLKPNLELGGGLAINNSFGYPMAFPAIYFKWTTGGQYSIEVSVLDGYDLNAKYQVNDNFSLSIIGEVNGQMALLKQEGKDKIFTHQYIVTGLRPEIKIGEYVSIPITAGIHAIRSAEMSDRKLRSMFKNNEYFFRLSPYVSAGIEIEL